MKDSLFKQRHSSIFKELVDGGYNMSKYIDEKMGDKPKLLTLEEIRELHPYEPNMSRADYEYRTYKCLAANDEYIAYQEKEIKRLSDIGNPSREAKLVDELLYYKDENEELKQRIAELEADNEMMSAALGVESTGYSCALRSRDETIAKLREALEFYAEVNNWWSSEKSIPLEFRKIIACDLEAIEEGNCGGSTARTTLKECFGDEDG